MSPSAASSPATRIGQGPYWQDLAVGDRFETFRRRVTETDLVNFISVTGMLEAIFIDPGHGETAMAGRPVPAALTNGLIEGFIMQGLIQGAGLALLDMHIRPLAPVNVGDAIRATVTITGVRATSKGGRGIVDSEVVVRNQDDDVVQIYDVKRLVAGRPS